MAGNIQREGPPARSRESEVFVALLRTADALLREAEELLKRWDLSQTQYNVLRILRGAGPEGLPCREIGSRMITRDPDITRLLDRLEARGLASRVRERHDRRMVTSRITAQGLRVLQPLDAPINQLHRHQFERLSARKLGQLMRLLEQAQERDRTRPRSRPLAQSLLHRRK